jgi:hypothetical protein
MAGAQQTSFLTKSRCCSASAASTRNPGSARSLRFDVSWMERLRRQAHPSHPRSRSGQVPTVALSAQNTWVEMPAKMTSEDFSAYGRDGVKAVLLHIGASDPEQLRDHGVVADLHSPRWLPKLHPTLDAMVDGEVAALRVPWRPSRRTSRQ